MNIYSLFGAIGLTAFSGLTISVKAEEPHEATPSSLNFLTGEGANVGGFLFPELFVNATGGYFEAGTRASDLATSEHDPQREAGIQAIELHLEIDFDDRITGAIYGAGQQGGSEWEATLEEAYLHFHLSEGIAIGGGQFLNTFGWQAKKHLHQWDFVNQNLINGRFLNEGELITQGGEVILGKPTNDLVLTLGGGAPRTHAHEDEEEHHHEDEGEEEEHHLEAEDAGMSEWIASADLKWRVPGTEATQLSASLAVGENGFGSTSYLYGAGIEKLWGAHDHGNGPELCADAWMIRSEFIGRSFETAAEPDEIQSGDDYGFSTSIFYGLSDRSVLSLRHDWVSEIEALELESRHRISPAMTFSIGKNEQLQARIQYDYNHSDSLPEEHAAWLQFQWQWGGQPGGHHH